MRGTVATVLFLQIALLITTTACRRRIELDGVLFAGCEDVTRNGVCWMKSDATRPLSIWLPTTDSSTVSVTLDGVRRPVRFVAVDNGVRFRITPPTRPALLRLQRRDATQVASWSLRVQPSRRPPALAAVEAHRRAGRFDAATRGLEALADGGPLVRAWVTGRKARLAMDRGRYDDARTLLKKSIRLAAASGLVSTEISDRSALAFLETHLGRYDAAEAALDAIAELESVYPAAARSARHYYLAYIATRVGDTRRSLRASEAVLRTEDRVGSTRYWQAAAASIIDNLHELGRSAEAAPLLRRLWTRVPERPACPRADALDTVGWLTADVAVNQQERALAAKFLNEAVTLYQQECRKPRRLAFARARLGLLNEANGNVAAAERWLQASMAVEVAAGAPLKKVRLLLAGHVALARADYAAAREAFGRLATYAAETRDLDAEWSSQLGLGRALEAIGRTDAAVEAYRAGEAVLDRAHLLVPMGAGRGGFLRHQSESARRLIDLLIRQGHARAAATAARHARGRGLLSLAWTASLDAAPAEIRRRWFAASYAYRQARRHDESAAGMSWTVPKEELDRRRFDRRHRERTARTGLDSALASLGLWAIVDRGPWRVAPGALLLSYHPIIDGWAAFAITASDVRVLRVDVDLDASPEVLSTRLLEPFADLIQTAKRIEIATTDVLTKIPFHTLPLRGKPLVWHRPVAYRVDAGRAQPVGRGSQQALVIAPHTDLRSTQPEARWVGAQLRDRGWTVKTMLGDGLSRARLARMLERSTVDWLHYAGHARLGGLDGWDSVLGTSDVPLLTVGDILLASRSPRHVVLAACESAAEAASGTRFGLGQAFIVAGASWVIAATRSVRDLDASTVARAVYRHLERHKLDPAEGLRAAQIEVAQRTPDVDWASFVLLVR